MSRIKAWPESTDTPVSDEQGLTSSKVDNDSLRFKPQSIPQSDPPEVHNSSAIFFNIAQYIFHLFNGDNRTSKLGQGISVILILNIIISFICSAAQTVPSERIVPTNCLKPACNNDPQLCPGKVICEPVTKEAYIVVDNVNVYIFTTEYGIRLLLFWAAKFRQDGDVEEEDEDDEDRAAKKLATASQPPLYKRYFKFVFGFQNLIDLICILPYWVQQASSGGGQPKAANFLRVFRILRVFKLIRYSKKPEQMLKLVAETMKNSLPALGVLSLFLVLEMIFFGSIIYQLEGGTFMVTEQYPEGQYMRPCANGYGMEISPFNSIPTCIYWVITTGTTVGYGDLFPTSWLGRMIANIVMIIGIVVLALPIGVLGSNFTALYAERLQLDWKKAADVLDVDGLDEQGIIDMFRHFDDDGTGSITRKEFLRAFNSAGLAGTDDLLGALFDKADEDGTGMISEEEFVDMCKKMQLAKRGVTIASTGTVDDGFSRKAIANKVATDSAGKNGEGADGGIAPVITAQNSEFLLVAPSHEEMAGLARTKSATQKSPLLSEPLDPVQEDEGSVAETSPSPPSRGKLARSCSVRGRDGRRKLPSKRVEAMKKKLLQDVQREIEKMLKALEEDQDYDEFDD